MEARGDERVLSWYALATTEPVTLYANTTLGDRGLNIVDDTSVAIGWMIELYEDGNVFQALVTGVTPGAGEDALTLDSPLPFAFTIAGATGRVGIRNAAVDGSTTDVPFTIVPPTGHIWDITNLMTYIHDQTAMDSSLFGGLAALTTGVVYRVYRSATVYEHIDNIKSNEEFFEHGWEVDYPPNMLTSHYAIRAYKRWGNEMESGSMLRLNGTKGEYLEILITDDIDALDLVKLVAHGYILQDGVPLSS
jgi:hypothetical protein